METRLPTVSSAKEIYLPLVRVALHSWQVASRTNLFQSLSLVVLVFTRLLVLSLFYAFVFAHLVGNDSAACADGSADQRAFSSTQQSASRCAACCGAADHLGRGVMTAIMRVLRLFGPLVAPSLCILRKT